MLVLLGSGWWSRPGGAGLLAASLEYGVLRPIWSFDSKKCLDGLFTNVKGVIHLTVSRLVPSG